MVLHGIGISLRIIHFYHLQNHRMRKTARGYYFRYMLPAHPLQPFFRNAEVHLCGHVVNDQSLCFAREVNALAFSLVEDDAFDTLVQKRDDQQQYPQ